MPRQFRDRFVSEPASRETRCRYCWARITRGENADLNVTYSVYFHKECPKEISPFPVIGRIDEAGKPLGDEPDNPYERIRRDRIAVLGRV